jgi:predicted ATPase/DNA-binding SARP family transcriptional activator
MGDALAGGVRFGILGPLAVTTSTGALRIGSQRQRLLLAVLVVEANRSVLADRLAYELWGDRLPRDPPGALRTQISRLRRVLPPDELVTEAGGYRLRVGPDALDANRFEQLFAAAVAAEGHDALRLLEAALELWRGPALDGFADRDFAQPHARRLEDLRGAAVEQRARLLLEGGRLAEAAAAVEMLLAEQPEREQARATLMEALYLLGRHTEALAIYQSWRGELGEEHGLEPSPALQRLESHILQHSLASPAPPHGRPRWTAPVPRPVSSYYGRDDDVRGAAALLSEVRLLTLWGPGGVGKTRLALELAAEVSGRYADGVHVCDLTVAERPADVGRALATGLGLRETAFRGLDAQLIDQLSHRQVLVILDNCEHVLAGAAPLAERITRLTGAVDVLATSRERLAVDGEHIWEVKPLPVSGHASAAVDLFVDRAQATNTAFDLAADDREIVADICRQLDGLPLAIELAAARVRGLSLAELGHGIDQRFQMLTAGPGKHARHRSLTAVLDWSYAQLAQPEQTVFDRLAVFCGPFDIDAARAVASGDGMSADTVTAAVLRLLDCALLVEHPEPAPSRYAFLDTTRRYGIGRLEACGALTAARDRHARWAIGLAEGVERGLNGTAEAEWAASLRRHLDELRTAHTWLVARDADASVRLVAALRPYALWRGTSEVFRWAEVAVAAAAGTGAPRLAEALLSASTGAWQRGDLDAATAAANMINDGNTPLDPAAARASLEARADVALLVGDVDAAATLFMEASTLACDAGELLQAVWDLGSASLAIAYGGDTQRAYALSAEVWVVAERCGSPSARAFAHFVAGEILAIDDPEAAEPHLLDAIQLAEAADSRFVVGLAEVALAAAKVRQQDVGPALAYCEAAISEWHRAGAWTPLRVTLRTIIDLLMRVEAYQDAGVLYGACTSTHVGAPPFGTDAARMRDASERLRAALGGDAFERHAQQGSTMTDDEVVALTLDALNRIGMSLAAQ